MENNGMSKKASPKLITNTLWPGLCKGDTLPAEMPGIFTRMRRDVTVRIRPERTEAEFAYFPIMAGDDLDEIAAFIGGCSRA